MIKSLRSLFRKKNVAPAPVTDEQKKEAKAYDPLDILQKHRGWEVASPPEPIQRGIEEFPMEEVGKRLVTDGRTFVTKVGDSNELDQIPLKNGQNGQTVPELLQSWYNSQSFIGYQSCAIIAQQWLVDKACSMIGQDASRNGWELKSASAESDDLETEEYHKLREFDVKFKLKENLAELDRFKNIFGIRVAIFCVESDDEKYYEKPFNIDGVTKGSYKGISQVDPYWMMPMMTAQSTSDPSAIHFYDPEFWIISGKKYHRSHLIIARGPAPADILKPTYIFGGIPLTQRIYERVYAAERTANEAPLLALNKRTTAIHVDVDKMVTQFNKFMEKMRLWVMMRDNHAVKVLGKEETMEQFDTSLADFDSVIMNQYQLVAAIAKTPATKLLGTSPKGFNATGEFEMKSYHEELESTQEHVFQPLLDRHYEILARSLGIECTVKIVFNPVDSLTAKELADINKVKSETYQVDVNTGAVSPDEVRERLKQDSRSGYTSLTDESANADPGMSPENLAEFEKAGAQEQKAQNEQLKGTAAMTTANASAQAEEDAEGVAAQRPAGDPPMAPNTPNPALKLAEPGIVPATGEQKVMALLKALARGLEDIETHYTPEGREISGGHHAGVQATVKPSVTGINPTVSGIGANVPQRETSRLPKMKLNGMLMVIENPRGSIRSGMDINGTEWSTKMPHHYGFIRGYKGADGDDVDCFIGPNLKADSVFVVNQNDPTTGEFDEHKCMFGFDTMEQAVQAYQQAYSDDWKGFGDVVGLGMDQFKHWLQSVPGPLERLVVGERVGDKAAWKEGDHPRAKNGQFGSGGGGASSGGEKQSHIKNPVKSSIAAGLGAKKDALPNLAKQMTEANKGTPPTPEQFHEAVTKAGFDIIPAQSVKYLKMYLKDKKASEGGEKKEATAESAPEQKKPEQASTTVNADHKKESEKIAYETGANSPAHFVELAAKGNGYPKEGTYNGIDYYKAGDGSKVSYKPDSDTWAAIKDKQVVAQGSGIESFEKYVMENKGQPAKPGTMAASPVSVSHKTESAKAYGDVVSAEKFSYASSGIANEKALPKKVQDAILAYKGPHYKEINNAMRFNDSFDPSKVSAETMAHILNLQRAFSAVAPSKNDVTVGRKIGLEGLKSMAKDAGLNDLNDLKEGMVLRDPGVISTSHSASVWSGNVKFEIKVPAGSKAIDISETITKNQSEQEVLLAPDSKLKISKVEKDQGQYQYHIVCELVK